LITALALITMLDQNLCEYSRQLLTSADAMPRASASGRDRSPDRKRHTKEEEPATPIRAAAHFMSDADRFYAIAAAFDETVDSDWAAIFRVPVDEERDSAPGYYAKVPDPVSLDQVGARLEQNVYRDVPRRPSSIRQKRRKQADAIAPSEAEESRLLRNDLQLFVDNSAAYNGGDHPVTDLARKMLREVGRRVFPLLTSTGPATPASKNKKKDKGTEGVAPTQEHEAINDEPLPDPVKAAVDAETLFGTSIAELAELARWAAEENVKLESIGRVKCLDVKALSVDQRRSLRNLCARVREERSLTRESVN
jgi:hypothetical protein